MPVRFHICSRPHVGLYEPFRRRLNTLVGRPVDDQIPLTSVMAGASSGAVGGMLPTFEILFFSYFTSQPHLAIRYF